MTQETTKMPFRFDAWHIKKGIWFHADKWFDAPDRDRYQLALRPGSGQFIILTHGGLSQVCHWLIPVAYTGVNDMNGTEARDNDRVIFEAGVTGGKAQGVVCWHRNGWHIMYVLCYLCADVCDLTLEVTTVCEHRKPACDPLPLGSSPFWITGNMYEADFKYEEAVADAGGSRQLVGS